MILTIDVGNSNLVLGVFDHAELQFICRAETDKNRTVDQTILLLKGLLALYGVESGRLEGAAISSVVPPVTDVVEEAVFRLIGKRSCVVGPGIKTGLNIKIDNPAQLGSDLVVDAVAAIEQYPLPVIIFDMGTATTISVVDKKACHLGGAIFPGVKVSLEALSNKAAQLPHIDIEAPDCVIGTNTIDSMRSGVIFGTAGMMDGMIDAIEKELNERCTVVATGGLSSEICKHTRHKIIHNGQLLLEGLYYVYLKNCPV